MKPFHVQLITLLLGQPQGWCDVRIWFSIRLYGPIKALSYSRHKAGASVSCGHISFLVLLLFFFWHHIPLANSLCTCTVRKLTVWKKSVSYKPVGIF